MSAFAVTGIGAVTPVGLSAPASAAALRAGIARLGEIGSTKVPGPSGTSVPALGGRVPLEWFDGGPKVEEWPGHERFGMDEPPAEHLLIEDGTARIARLAAHAAAECWLRSGRSGAPGEGTSNEKWGLFLGLGENEDAAADREVVRSVRRALGDFEPAIADVKREGRASFLLAAQRAFTALDSGSIDGAFVGGVDSLIRPSAFSRLSASGALRDPSSNPQGVLPGESAAFLLLERRGRDAAPLARLAAAAAAVEPTAGTDTPNRGAGLSAAVRAARKAAPLESMPLVVCDLNGDRLRAIEWAMVQTRVLGDLAWRDDLHTSGETWHPADCIGDTGAGCGGVDCIVAVEALARGYALTDRVLVWGASDGPLRAAALFSRAE